MTRIFFFAFFSFFFLISISHAQIVFIGTPGQIAKAQLMHQIKQGLNDYRALRVDRIKKEAELEEARKNFWSNTENKNFREIYIQRLFKKDMHFLMVRWQNLASNSTAGTTVDALVGMGKEFDEGIGGYCLSEFNVWVESIYKTFISEGGGGLNALNTALFRESMERNIDSYINYVVARDSFEFLFKNPQNPIESNDPLQYLVGLHILMKSCKSWGDCYENMLPMKAGMDKRNLRALMLSLKYTVPEVPEMFKTNWGNRDYIEGLIEKFVFYSKVRTSSFNLEGIDGKSTGLFEFSKKKGVILAFTSSSCDRDYYAIEKLNNLNDKYGKLGFPVVAVNSKQDAAISLSEMKRKSNGKGYNFQYLKDTDGKLAASFGVKYTPTVYVVVNSEKGYFIHYAGPLFHTNEDGLKLIEESVESILGGDTYGTRRINPWLWGNTCSLAE